MIDLMKYLPDFYENNITMKELQGILSEIITKFDDGRNEVLDNCFISTASKLLSRYEEVFNLEVDVNKSDTFRRERLKAKVRGSGTTTKQLINQVAESFSLEEVEIIEDSKNYMCFIRFVETLEELKNIKDFKVSINEIMPAHLLVILLDVIKLHYNVEMDTNTNLEILSNFYPRYNLEPRTLNGSWLLNGKCLLSGYKADTILDFYPVSLMLESGANNDITVDHYLQLDSLTEEITTTKTELEMLSDTKQEIQTESELILDSKTEQGIECESILTIEKDLWQLNGKVQLNGSRLLDAKITTFTL